MKIKITILAIIILATLLFSFGPVKAAYVSQCTVGQEAANLQQSGCTNVNDSEVLAQNCTQEGYSGSTCASMSAYLFALRSTCSDRQPPPSDSLGEINCDSIPLNTIYGRDAKRMADYVENVINNSNGPGSSNTTPGSNTTTQDGLECDSNGICFPANTNLPDPAEGVIGIITNLLYWILSIFGILAIIAFVISGIQYILSAGSEKAIDTAKASMKWSIVGVAVALVGLVIIYAIDKMLRATPNF
jgi:hypothetical protein